MICYYKIFSFFMIPFASSVMGYEGRDIDVYTTLVSGYFSNAKSLSELRKSGIVAAQNLLESYAIPIDYPALNSDIVLFCYDLKDGNVTREMYVALNQSGPVISVELYNVERYDLLNLASSDVSNFESLSTDHLHTAPSCKSYITRIGETRFNAEYGSCNAQGFNSAKFTATHSCDGTTFNIEIPENKIKLTYMLNKMENYPVPVSIFIDYEKYKAMCGY